MKKINFIAVLLLVCTIPFVTVDAKKKKPVEPQKSATELEIERLKQEKELRALKAEMEEDSIRRARQRELDDAKQEMKIAAMNSQERLEDGMKMLLIPCTEEMLQLENSETMAAQGIATGKRSEEDAMLDANRVALSDITTRFLGVIKNGVEQYSKDTRAESGNRGLQSQLEGLAVAVGEKEINKQFKVACRKFAKDKVGNYNCYEALYVQTEKILDAIIDAAEEEKVDFDKHLFRQRMQAELDRQAEKQEAINKEKLENLRAAKEEMGM